MAGGGAPPLPSRAMTAISPPSPAHAAAAGASPSGKAPVFGTGIRRFESCRPSQFPLASETDAESHQGLVLVEILRSLVQRIAIFGFEESAPPDRELGPSAETDAVRMGIGDEVV